MTIAPYIVGTIFFGLFILAVRCAIKRGPCEGCSACHGGCGCGCDGKPPEAPKADCPRYREAAAKEKA